MRREALWPIREPRFTGFWRRQTDLLTVALRETLTDPAIRQYFLRLAQIRGARAGVGVTPRPDDVGLVAEIGHLDGEEVLGILVALVEDRGPLLKWAFGPWLAAELVGLADMAIGRPNSTPGRLYRFLPDNPLTLNSGEAVLNGKQANPVHWREISEYFQSLQPAPSRGRPSGTGHLAEMTTEELRRAYRDLAREFRRRSNGRPTRHDLAAALGVTAATLDRALRLRGIQWPPD